MADRTAFVSKIAWLSTGLPVASAPRRRLVGGAHAEALEAERIILNVGARARIPDMPGVNAVDYLTNSSMMEVDFLPEHLVIIGGSYIGLEFAQMYRRFGSRVTVIEMGDRLIARDDEDVSAAVKEILETWFNTQYEPNPTDDACLALIEELDDARLAEKS